MSEDLFTSANRIISNLPIRQRSGSIYQLPENQSGRSIRLWERAAEQLKELAIKAPEKKKIYFFDWARDAYIGAGNLHKAITTMPDLAVDGRSSLQADILLSLKYAVGNAAVGRDLVALFGPNLTKFGRENIGAIVEWVDIISREMQAREGRDFLTEWGSTAPPDPNGFGLFNGHASYIVSEYPSFHSFSRSSAAKEVCMSLMREAENTYREENQIPRVGEGWVSETALFYSVKDAFSDEVVIQHARPEWLGRQHLDIFMPDRRVAIEFQGEQHDRPIDFFGGVEAFEKNKERDRRKLLKCNKNNVEVIYARKGYDISDIFDQIVKKSTT